MGHAGSPPAGKMGTVMADAYRENAGTVFFWGLVVCLILAIVVHMIG